VCSSGNYHTTKIMAENQQSTDNDEIDDNLSANKKRQKTGDSEFEADENKRPSKKQKSSDTPIAKPLKKRFPQLEPQEDKEKSKEKAPDKVASDDENSLSSSSSGEEFNDGFDENLFAGEEDRKTLMALPETQREAILFERSEKRLELQRRWRILKEEKRRQREERRKEKEKQRKEMRAETETKENRKAALDDLVARREKQKAGRRSQDYDLIQKLTKRAQEGEKNSDDEIIKEDGESSTEAKGESQETPKKPPKKAIKGITKVQPPVEETPPPVLITHHDIRSIQLTRAKLEKWLGEPYWDKVRGLFVRVGVGMTYDPVTREPTRPVYKLAEIVDFEPGPKTYKLTVKKTNLLLHCKLGTSIKSFRIEYISNSGVTEDEFNYWVKIMQKAKLPILTPQEVSQRRQQIEYADNYVWTDSEINKRIEEARKLKLRPVNIVRERFNLMEELQLLQVGAPDDADTKAKIAEIKQRLEELNQMEAEMERQNKEKMKIDFTAINRRNIALNMEAAMLRSTVRDLVDPTNDPFSRRPTLPQYDWLHSIKAKDKSSDSSQDEDKNKQTKTDDTKNEKNAKEQTKEEKEVKEETNVTAPPSSELGVSIDIDIDLTINKNSSPKDVKKEVNNTSDTTRELTTTILNAEPSEQLNVKKTLTLSDYKRRRGLLN
jgi:RNA polymerase-associated protein RTF1